MRGSKLIALLKKMDKNEFFQLEKFVKTTFFNSNKYLPILFDFLKDGYPDFKSAHLTKKNAAKLLFPDTEVTDKRIANIMSDMYHLIMDFFAQMEFQNNHLERSKIKAQALKKKELFQEYTKELSKFEEILEEQPSRNVEYYWNLFELNNRKYHNRTTPLNNSKILIEEMMDGLDKFFVLGKLKLRGEMTSREMILGENYPETLLLKATKTLAMKSFEVKKPLFEMYFYIIELLQSGEPHYYWKLKNLFFAKHNLMGEESKLEVLSYLMNYTVSGKARDNKDFLAEGFELYKFGFTNGILHENLPSAENVFQNMIIMGAQLGHFDWVESFLETVEMSEVGYSEDVIVFAKANILFHKKEFSSARELILSHPFQREQDKIRIKTILIKILYEEYLLDDSVHEVLMATIQAFQKYLKRNKKLPTHRIVPFISFAKVLKMLIRLRFQRVKSKTVKEKIKKDIDSQTVLSKEWIIEKINSL